MNTRSSVSPWAILTAILLGTFVGTLANSTANVVLPAVMAEFDVPLSSALWIVTLYTLIFAVLMPVCGYLGDLYGQRRMYLSGMALFTLAALGSGIAPSFPCLLASRVLLGIGVAPTLPAVMGIISSTFPPQAQGRAVGFWALVNGAGHALGPPLSGFLVQHFGWRAVFVLGLPLGLINVLMVWRLVPPDEPPITRKFDFVGAASLTLTALGLMLALTQSVRWGWSAPGSLLMWGSSILALVTFVVVERRVASPFVDLELFTNRHYAAASGVIAIQIFCLFGLLLALPVFLIQDQGWSDQTAGLLILPLPLTMAILAPLAGRLADTYGSRWTCTVGMALVALAGATVLALRPTSDQRVVWWGLVGSLVTMGAGMALVQSPAAAAVTRVVEQERLGVATGVFHMGRFVSGSLGGAIFGLLMEMNEMSGSGIALGFQRDLLVLVALSTLAILIAQGLPGSTASTRT